MLLLLGAVLVPGASGCWLEAIQFIPPALSAAQGLSSGAMAWAETEKIPPAGVIELRKGPDGGTEYRELRVDVSFDEAQWVPVVDENNPDAQGWHPAKNLAHMSFDPPLTGVPPQSGTAYLAYLGAEAESESSETRRAEFAKCFGAPIGVFTFEGRGYNYSLPKSLSCAQ
jgi:hypothetical protein